jgi:acyl-coenzyme A synthetase/AMP-(fatty) acid ligase
MKMVPLQLEDLLKSILAGPIYPQMTYVDGVTFQELYNLAMPLRYWLQQNVPEKDVCLLYADDKAVIMAALLAAMFEKRILILPNILSFKGADALKRTTKCRYAIMDKQRSLPEGIEAIVASDVRFKTLSKRFQPQEGLTLDPDIVWVQLYTGGSTAEPKIWNKTIRNLMGEALFLSHKFEVNSEDRIVATVPSYHIYGLLYSILVPFIASAYVCQDMPYYPKEISQTVCAQNATILISVPPHYRALCGHSCQNDTLRLAFSSAGMLAAEDGQAFTRNNGVKVVEIYGSTETGGVATRIRARGESAFRPFECVTVKIEAEQLWVKSDFLSPGLKGLDSGFFKLNDRVQVSYDGQFVLLGRTDGVLKVGGRRVDSETIRQAFFDQAGVTDVAILSLPLLNGRENQIVAAVEGKVDRAILSKRIASTLETYARPRSIKVVEKMPYTDAGKYDRNALMNLFKA